MFFAGKRVCCFTVVASVCGENFECHSFCCFDDRVLPMPEIRSRSPGRNTGKYEMCFAVGNDTNLGKAMVVHVFMARNLGTSLALHEVAAGVVRFESC